MWTLQEVALANKAVFVHSATAKALDSLQADCNLHRYECLGEDNLRPYCIDSDGIGHLIHIAARQVPSISSPQGNAEVQSMNKDAKIWQVSSSSKWDLLNVVRAAGSFNISPDVVHGTTC